MRIFFWILFISFFALMVIFLLLDNKLSPRYKYMIIGAGIIFTRRQIKKINQKKKEEKTT